MKNALYLVLGLLLVDVAHAALVSYRFVGASDPAIDFTIDVDTTQEGFFIAADGSRGVFDPPRDTFLATYRQGNFTLAPAADLSRFFYGEDILTPEGVLGCLYVLNTLSVCDPLDAAAVDGGGVSGWRSGRFLDLSLFNNMGPLDDFVVLESISTVPLPATLPFLLSGLATLFVAVRRQPQEKTG